MRPLRDDPGGCLLDRDRALVTRASDERCDPLEHCDSPVLKARQERQVHEGPHQPADEAADLDALEADDRPEPCDRRHAAEIAVYEWLRRVAASQAALDRAPRVYPRLHRDLRDAWQIVQRHHVADHEDLGMAGQRAVGQHLDPARSVGLCPACGGEDGPQR